MENDMKKLITIALLCGALLLSGCGDGELPLTKLEMEQEQRIEELEAELEQAEARLAEAEEALAGAGEGAEYSLENMIRVEPEFSQAVVNCPEGILVSPVEPQLKCGHPMENEYVEVVAKCRLKPSSAPSRARPGGLSETRPEADKQAAPARSDALCRSLFALARLSYAFFDAKNLCFQSQHLYCQKLGWPFVGIHQFMPLRTNWRKLLTAGGV